MCLDVAKSHVRKPIAEMECFKILRYGGSNSWMTPYQDSVVVRDTGWFMPKEPAKRKVREYRKLEVIEGGYIHAYTNPIKGIWWSSYLHDGSYDNMPRTLRIGSCYRFRAIARDVVALGDDYDSDLVCRALYIPAFDITGKHRNAILDMY